MCYPRYIIIRMIQYCIKILFWHSHFNRWRWHPLSLLIPSSSTCSWIHVKRRDMHEDQSSVQWELDSSSLSLALLWFSRYIVYFDSVVWGHKRWQECRLCAIVHTPQFLYRQLFMYQKARWFLRTVPYLSRASSPPALTGQTHWSQKHLAFWQRDSGCDL